jgi:Tfp pilus assembly PilM family ATPase
MKLGRKKKNPEPLGIHVGRTRLTIVRVAENDDGVTEILELFSRELNRDEAGWPVELIRSTLADARREVNLKAKDARMTVASDLAPSHFLVLPVMKGEKLSNAVKLQLQNKWGNDGSDLSFQYQPLEKRGDRCRVFAPSIPTERLRLLLGSFAEVNCPIDSMEVEGVSLANLMVRTGLLDGAPISAIQVEPAWGEIYLFRRKQVVLSRPIPKQEGDFTSSGEHAAVDADPEENQPGGSETADPADRLGSVYLGRVAREANKTLDYFEIELLSPPVERLFLIGEAADTPGLAEFLAGHLELAVEALGDSDHIHDTTGAYEPALHALAVAAAAGGKNAP